MEITFTQVAPPGERFAPGFLAAGQPVPVSVPDGSTTQGTLLSYSVRPDGSEATLVVRVPGTVSSRGEYLPAEEARWPADTWTLGPDGLKPPLTRFLADRLDEDRAFADALAEEYAQMGPVIEGVTENKLHALMRHTAVRTLAEIDAKRKHLAAYQASVRSVGEGLSVPERRVVEADATVYSDHPNYDPSWA